MRFYTRNQLENPDASAGDTSEWTVMEIDVSAEGEDPVMVPTVTAEASDTEGGYVFVMDPVGWMHQNVSPIPHPPDFRVEILYLPETERGHNITVRAWGEVRYEYGDDTYDEYNFPLELGWSY